MPLLHRRSAWRVVPRLVGASVGLLLAACATPSASGHVAVPSSTSQSAGGTSGTFLDRALPASLAQLELTDQNGATFTLASLRGKTVVLTDFLTLCSEICPLTTVNMERAQADSVASHRTDAVFLEVTVDPQRDTPARMKTYAGLYGPKQGLRFATASADGLAELWNDLGVYYAKTKPDAGARDWLTGKPLTYDVAHQDLVFVLGPDGHERWVDDGTPDTDGQAPPSTLKAFLSEQGKENLTAPADPTWTARDIETALARVSGRTSG